jgi:hypothetical protein
MVEVEEVKKHLDDYWKWLKDRTSLRKATEWVEITTPFLDRHNDFMQIYVRKEDEQWTMTDGGSIIQDLRMSGCDLDTDKRKRFLEMALNGFGVSITDNDMLIIRSTATTFPGQKHRLIQAMLAVDDLFYTSSSVVRSLFYEDVMQWLDKHEIRYSPRVSLAGKSGFTHTFDFIIPRSLKAPERVVQAISTPDKQRIELLAFSWLDTRETRSSESKAIAVLNDKNGIPGSSMEALKQYNIEPAPWAHRNELVDMFAA